MEEVLKGVRVPFKGVLESRLVGSVFWILPGLWVKVDIMYLQVGSLRRGAPT